jgi:hypothetical protein
MNSKSSKKNKQNKTKFKYKKIKFKFCMYFVCSKDINKNDNTKEFNKKKIIKNIDDV